MNNNNDDDDDNYDDNDDYDRFIVNIAAVVILSSHVQYITASSK